MKSQKKYDNFKKISCGLLAIALLSLFHGNSVHGHESDPQDDFWKTYGEFYDFRDVDREMDNLFPRERIKFSDVMEAVISGDTAQGEKVFREFVKDSLSHVFINCRKNLIYIFILSIAATIINRFSALVENEQVSEVGYYAIYLMMLALTMSSFEIMAEWVSAGIERISSFMSVFCPVFFVSVTIARGSLTSLAFYNLILLLMTVAERMILRFIIPLIRVFFMVRMLNYLAEEDYLTKLSEFIRTLVLWTLKSILALVVGINTIQSLMSPAIDTVKRSAVTRGAEAIPGIGDAIGGAAEVALGSAVLIKNGIGVTGMIVSIILCMAPVIQIGGTVLLYRLAAAIIQPLSDKRTIGCIECVSDGGEMLMRALVTTGILFLITIVVVSIATEKI